MPQWHDILAGMALVAGGLAAGALKPDLGRVSVCGRAIKAVKVVAVGVGISFLVGILSLGHASNDNRRGPTWRSDVEGALADARRLGKPAVLDAGADWCAACKELERETFGDPEVIEALDGFVTIRADLSDPEAFERMSRLGLDIKSLPWVGFFLPDGRLNPGVTLNDFEPPGMFLRRIEASRTYRQAPVSQVDLWLGERGLVLALFLVFLAGLGVSLTPCVYPMIPITIAVVGAGSGAPGKGGLGWRASRSAAFVSGLVVVYSVLGVVSATIGKGFGSWIESPAVSLGMAALFLALAASFLGYFRMDLPQSLKTAMGRSRGGLVGAVLLGGATGFVAAPCAGPVVVGILAVVSRAGNVALGFALMLAFALGMGVLFFVIGLSTALLERLPRSGAWMERVEIAFAIVFVVLAVHYGSFALH